MTYSKGMNQKLLKCFTDALNEVFSETGIRIDSIEESGMPDNNSIQLVTSIGITGNIKGSFLMMTDLKTAQNIADTMMLSMNIPYTSDQFGPLREAALAEITNQISGHAVTHLYEENISCDITPPTILIGDHIKLMTSNLNSLTSRTVTGDVGILYIIIGVKN